MNPKMKYWALAWLFMHLGMVMAQDSIRVRVRELPPLMQQDGSGRWSGLDIELMEVLLAEAKLSASYHVSPGKRGHAQLQSGEMDAMMNTSMTEERKQYLHFIGPARHESIVLVVPKQSSYAIQSLDDFKKMDGLFGIQTGAFYGEAFAAKMASDPVFAAKFDGLPMNDMNIKKMNAGRILGYFSDPLLVAYRIKTDPDFAAAKIHPFVVNQGPTYFVFSKKSVSAATFKRLEAAYARAKAAGKFEKVLKRYQ